MEKRTFTTVKKFVFTKEREKLFNLITLSFSITVFIFNLMEVWEIINWELIPFVNLFTLIILILFLNISSIKKYSLEQSVRFREMGLDDSPKLFEDSEFYPQKLMKNVTNSLDFVGTTASKYTIGDNPEMSKELYETFREMLFRLRRAHGEVRFLLINPTQKVFEKLNDAREQKTLNTKSYENLLKLVNEFPDVFKVRFYESELNFRYTNFDRKKICYSKYSTTNSQYIGTDKGRQSHQLVFSKPNTIFSVFETFELLFHNNWEQTCSKLNNIPIELNNNYFKEIQDSVERYNRKKQTV